MSEHLVIITNKEPEEILLRMQEHQIYVMQSVSKRVFLVQGNLAELNVSDQEGLRIFSTPDVPEEILDFLDDKETLFVSAWQTRLRQLSKKRPGERLNWDHPNFKPPR